MAVAPLCTAEKLGFPLAFSLLTLQLMACRHPARHRFIDRSPNHAAKTSGLRYVTDSIRGITRRRTAKEFCYYSQTGRRLRDLSELGRIKSLVIPPAWQGVWISPFPHSHLQATGRDTKGRKQYRYHPRWREIRDQTKYGRMTAVGRVLPMLRARVAKDLARPGLPRAKVIATVVRLLENHLDPNWQSRVRPREQLLRLDHPA